ncbi:DUF4138 domain-containing protein [Pedobacter paludis]|uniref:Conjugative transposon protein TraN n=1 Tax=Pedobacter paludis TaxID=2203212 RepID=A0A317F202_9SPHI|nr:DUF4138 domain-containing protein [Pedobacter paludis]PWS32672.1 conjugative transposon protein TraN [Pedobacter paludis]
MMKNFLLIVLNFLLCRIATAQELKKNFDDRLPLVGISRNATLHFISPENISYVDISTPALKGDLPLSNILRLKISSDSSSKLVNNADVGIVTVVGETFIAQYRIYFLPPWESAVHPVLVDISPTDCRPISAGVDIPIADLKKHAFSLLREHSSNFLREEEKYGVSMSLKQIYTLGDYIFFDLKLQNNTNLPFDIDALSFSIDDRKITKATNVQSVSLNPVWQLYAKDSFKKSYRNIYVLKKMTYPENKLLNISLKEKQISGRNLVLQIPYKDVLRADTF